MIEFFLPIAVISCIFLGGCGWAASRPFNQGIFIAMGTIITILAVAWFFSAYFIAHHGGM